MALFLLLSINLFNYIDRQVLAALEPEIRATFFHSADQNAMALTGLLGSAEAAVFSVSSTCCAFSRSLMCCLSCW